MIAIVAAVAKNGVIGAKNELPWHIPEDLKRFRELTHGKIVLMGRKTFDSIMARNGKPLPERTNAVVTTRDDLGAAPGVLVFHSIDEALANFAGADVYVIGGGEIYRQTIDRVDTLYLTELDRDVPGDVYFPAFNRDEWKVLYEDPREGFRFVTYRRKQ